MLPDESTINATSATALQTNSEEREVKNLLFYLLRREEHRDNEKTQKSRESTISYVMCMKKTLLVLWMKLNSCPNTKRKVLNRKITQYTEL